MSTCFLIVGTPRSGTSCLGGVLSRLGIPMGNRLVPGNPMNSLGFYQDFDCEEVFYSTLPPDQYVPPVGWELPDDRKEMLRNYVKHRIADAGDGDWGLKCVKIPFVFDFFKQLCRDRLRLLVMKRDPELSIASLANWWPEANQSPRQMVTRCLQAIDDIVAKKNIISMTVDYDALLADPAGRVSDVAAFCNKDVVPEAVEHVRADLRRLDGSRGIRGRSEKEEAEALAVAIEGSAEPAKLLRRLAYKFLIDEGVNAAAAMGHLQDDESEDWMTRRERWLRRRG